MGAAIVSTGVRAINPPICSIHRQRHITLPKLQYTIRRRRYILQRLRALTGATKDALPKLQIRDQTRPGVLPEVRRFHVPDTSTDASCDSAGSYLYATTCSKATSASASTATATVCATRAKGTTGYAEALGNTHSWHAKACDASCAEAATKTTNTSIHSACAASHCANRSIAFITDYACKTANQSQTGEPASY